MCNYDTVRNWLIAMGIMVVAAVTSALFAGALSKALPPPLIWIAAVSFAAAASWAGLGIVVGIFARNAINAYCACIAEGGNAGCSQHCTPATSSLDALMTWLSTFGLVCAIAALVGPVTLLTIYLLVHGVGVIGAFVVALVRSSALESCRTQQPPPT